uniref:C2H2-type domain-containing protein n=1 Tax=Strigamia maritima TaxID=126957 RepID=T1J483_STRMM
MDNSNVTDFSIDTSNMEQKESNETVNLDSNPAFLDSSQLSKEDLALAQLADMSQTNCLNSRSAFQVELQAVSQAEHQLPTLWFTATPVLPHTSFHGLGVQSLTCPTSSDSDLVQVCLPQNNFHQSDETIHVEASSLSCSTLNSANDLETCHEDERKVENDLSCQDMLVSKVTPNNVYRISPGQLNSCTALASVKGNTTDTCAHLSHEDSSAYNSSQVSLIELRNANQVENMELHSVPSHLQAEIVYQDSNGEISLSTTTVQIPIIRSESEIKRQNENNSFPNSKEISMNDNLEIPHQTHMSPVPIQSASATETSRQVGYETKLEGFVETVECYKCRLCPFISLSKNGVQEHVQSDHTQVCQPNSEEGDNYGSDVDAESSDNSDYDGSSMVIKQLQSNGTEKFVCNRCAKEFDSFQACAEHVVNEHQMKCVEVQKVSNDKNQSKNRRQRRRKADDDADYVGRELNTRRKQKVPRKMQSSDSSPDEGSNKKRHRSPKTKTILRKKKNKAPCEVDDCAIRMKSIDNLEYHRRCHVKGVAGFTCPECHEKFDHWRNISVHLWRVHVIDMELYACDQCSYKTYSLSKLINMHKRIHSEERPFLCDNCGKGFKTSKQLRNHKVIHLDKRRQRSFRSGECDVCHHTVHNKLRPFLCNYCGYAASCRSTLKMHMRQHTGEKPFSCNFCAYRTADHNSLRRHKMRHSGEKPYKCPFCPYACIQSSTYKTHLKNKHPGQDEGLMYSCNLCAFRTIKKENFITHMADHKAGAIPVQADAESADKNEPTDITQHHTLLVQDAESLSTITHLDRLPNNLPPGQIMFSTIDKIRNKIAIAAQGFPLEISQMDRYPILVGQLKASHLDNTTVVHIDPNIQLDNNQQFLLQEPLETTEQHLQNHSIHLNNSYYSRVTNPLKFPINRLQIYASTDKLLTQILIFVRLEASIIIPIIKFLILILFGSTQPTDPLYCLKSQN